MDAHPSASKGNNSVEWQALLDELDEKLQFGLLDRLRRVSSYHFEDRTLTVQPGNEEDLEYLRRDAVFQQLQLFATDTTSAERVEIKES